MKKRSVPVQIRLLLIALVCGMALWILWAEFHALPDRRSVFVEVPISTNLIQGHPVVTVTNRPVEIEAPGGISTTDFTQIRKKLRSFAYRGFSFNAIEIKNKDLILVWNTNKMFKVQFQRDEGSWRGGSYVSKGIVD